MQKSIIRITALATALVPFAAQSASLGSSRIVPEKELLITDVAVVDSAETAFPGRFSFGHLMVQMAGVNDPSEFVKTWLKTWERSRFVNSHPLPARSKIRELILDPWKKKDGFEGRPDEEWVVDFGNAPFRLLAIVNRMDLAPSAVPPEPPDPEEERQRRRRPAYYFPQPSGPIERENAGEGRFVFAALDPTGAPLAGDFTIIFEYRLKISTDLDITRWARDWHALAEFEAFDSDYVEALATLTDIFVTGGTPSTNIVTGDRETAIRQIRTSEASFHPDREFREFTINKEGFLEPNTLAGTPAVRFQRFGTRTWDNDALAKLINDNGKAIADGDFSFPKNVVLENGKTAKLLAARAIIPEGQGKKFHWDARGIKHSEGRRTLSFNTCNGCHAAETDTDSCLHIHPRLKGEPAKLSKFLDRNGAYTVSDPGAPGHRVKFSEMQRREDIMKHFLRRNMTKTLEYRLENERLTNQLQKQRAH